MSDMELHLIQYLLGVFFVFFDPFGLPPLAVVLRLMFDDHFYLLRILIYQVVDCYLSSACAL